MAEIKTLSPAPLIQQSGWENALIFGSPTPLSNRISTVFGPQWLSSYTGRGFGKGGVHRTKQWRAPFSNDFDENTKISQNSLWLEFFSVLKNFISLWLASFFIKPFPPPSQLSTLFKSAPVALLMHIFYPLKHALTATRYAAPLSPMLKRSRCSR